MLKSLVLISRDTERLNTLANELGAQAPELAIEIMACDLAEEDACRTLSSQLAERPIDLLVNNAGFGTYGPFAESSPDEEAREVHTNVVAPLRLARACLPGMLQRGGGAVINVSSLAGETPSPRSATYGATKAFLTHFSESLHEELRGSGVRVQALLPGFTRTEFQQRAGIDASKIPSFAWMSPESVVEASLSALARDELLCIPGKRYRALYRLARLTPRSWLRRASGAGADRFA